MRDTAHRERYRRVLEKEPGNFEALNNLGLLFQQEGQLQEAYRCYQRALEVAPTQRSIHINLAGLLCLAEVFPEAIHHCLEALKIDPQSHLAAYTLGLVFRKTGQGARAIPPLKRCLELKPDFHPAYDALGAVLRQQGDWSSAMACFRKALELCPEDADAHYDLGMALLAEGAFAQGWQEFEWRWKSTAFRGARPLHPQPRWKGEPLAGRRLLVYSEQGLGDAIQFVRYLPVLAQRGATLLLECPESLAGLFRDSFPACEVFEQGGPLPEVDFQCPLMSLPMVLGTRLESLPGQTPYLRARADKTGLWRERLVDRQRRLKVGLVWAGNPAHALDSGRSIPLSAFLPLTSLSNVGLYSLQTGERAWKDTRDTVQFELEDPASELRDFSDTAAVIQNLDLILSVDTAAAHLAGAMNKPVWTLLPGVADWRWLRHREDSPWYPSMRLFRQTRPGDWPEVLQRVRSALQAERLAGE